MSQKVKAVRSRAPNFTKQEQILLFHSMEPYSHIIESKQTDSIKQVDKQMAWVNISEVYNANTVGQQRSVDNLISCYRNVKSKLKKQQSEAKMFLQDPSKKEELLKALEEHGENCEEIASSINVPTSICQNSIDELKKIAKKDDILLKKKVLGTGGGPPPSQADPLSSIKKLIEPQMDGMFTIFDGDAELMDQFQKSKPPSEQIKPIELDLLEFNKENMISDPSTSTNTDEVVTPPAKKMETRTDFLRKKRAPELGNDYESSNKRRTVKDSFYNLSEEKLQLVQMQKELLQMEVQHKKKMYALELEGKINENKFKAELHLKELQLLEIKIKKENQ